MRSPLLELQAAIYDVLSSSLKSAPVYDHVPDSEKLPIVAIGEASGTNASPKIEYLWNVMVSIHIYSRYHGSKEIKEIINEVVETLSGDGLSLDGFIIVISRFDNVSIVREDENIRHAIIRWRYLIQEG